MRLTKGPQSSTINSYDTEIEEVGIDRESIEEG